MAFAEKIRAISEAEFLRMERKAETRSEFFKGEIFAMAGGTPAHSLIASNLLRELGNAMKGGDCVVFNSDLRLKVEATGLITYPDVSVVCGEQRFLEGDTLLNPTVLAEVLSDSTEAYDRGKKFEHYRRIPSCQAVLLISQHEPKIEEFVLQPGGEWVLIEAAGTASELPIPPLGVHLRLAEVFANARFDARLALKRS